MRGNRFQPSAALALFICACLADASGAVPPVAALPARPNPLWFWNDAPVARTNLFAQMRMCRDAGYGGLSILPFGAAFRPDYLSDAYFELYGSCADEARRLGMTLWIYDEYGFPSGSAGFINGDGVSRFAERFPDRVIRRLDKIEREASGGETVSLACGPGTLMAAVAMEVGTKERRDLSACVKDGLLTWTAPEGRWKAMLFTAVKDEPIMDYLDPDAAAGFLELTHEAYRRRLGNHFGTTIVGTFFDEPTLYRAQGRTWTVSFNARFERAHGFSPALLYPALWYDIGPATAEARNLLFGFRSELYATGYIKAVSEWSLAHGLHATGHQDNEEVVNPVGTSGDLMKCFRHLDIPGIDKIGGPRPAERFCKVVSSAAHNWNHRYVMSETYGAMGDIEWSEIYDIAMDQYTKGVNLLIPHAVWYDDSKVVFPPELSPRHPRYRDGLPAFTEFLTRLNENLQPGRTVCDAAVLYPIASMQADHYFDGPLGFYAGGVELPYLDYVEVSRILTDELGRDFEFLHPEVLEKCIVRGDGRMDLVGTSQAGGFRALVIPSCTAISRASLERAGSFLRSGGRLVFTGTLPTRGTREADDAAVRALTAELLANGAKHVPRLAADALSEALGAPTDVRFAGSPLRVIHRRDERGETWYFANPTGHPADTVAELRGAWRRLEELDPHTGERKVLECAPRDAWTACRIVLPPHRSVLIRAQGHGGAGGSRDS